MKQTLTQQAAKETETLIRMTQLETTAATQQAINDLSMRVAAPDGTLYVGNAGLEDEMWSVAGLGAFDTVNTIENVFVENPAAGEWFVEVRATAVVEDNHLETPEFDCDYALVAVGGVTRESSHHTRL